LLGKLRSEDHSLRPAQANSFQDPIFKITLTKGTGGVAQGVEHMLYKHKALNPNPSPNPSQKKSTKKLIK
jgi:hypothetical protein